MKTNHTPALAVRNRWKFKGWIVCGAPWSPLPLDRSLLPV
jgi:hypothetical protein